jgi:hypothetical protein
MDIVKKYYWYYNTTLDTKENGKIKIKYKIK